jgi:hypothetical protein
MHCVPENREVEECFVVVSSLAILFLLASSSLSMSLPSFPRSAQATVLSTALYPLVNIAQKGDTARTTSCKEEGREGTTSESESRRNPGRPQGDEEEEKKEMEGERRLCGDVSRVHYQVGTVEVVRRVRGEEKDRTSNLIDATETGPRGLVAVVDALRRVGAV